MSEGREQTCPPCGITEAKGKYCTRCLRSTRAEWIHSSARGRNSANTWKQLRQGEA
jgi:hypothetical protein